MHFGEDALWWEQQKCGGRNADGAKELQSFLKMFKELSNRRANFDLAKGQSQNQCYIFQGGKFPLNMRSNFLIKRCCPEWNGLYGEGVDPLSLEVLV